MNVSSKVIVSLKEVKTGDVIQFLDWTDAFGEHLVVYAGEGKVKLARPYMTVGYDIGPCNVAYSGLEQYEVPASDRRCVVTGTGRLFPVEVK